MDCGSHGLPTLLEAPVKEKGKVEGGGARAARWESCPRGWARGGVTAEAKGCCELVSAHHSVNYSAHRWPPGYFTYYHQDYYLTVLRDSGSPILLAFLTVPQALSKVPSFKPLKPW